MQQWKDKQSLQSKKTKVALKEAPTTTNINFHAKQN